MKCSGIGYVALAVVLWGLEVQSFLNNQCAGYASYDTLVDLIRHDKCLTIDSVFYYLKDLTRHFGDGHCRTSAIQYLSGHFGRNATNGHCGCSGNNTFQKYEHDWRIGDHLSCLKYDAYKDLYNQFFINNETHTISDCKTHHSVWYTLNRIFQQESHSGTCQRDIVYHISNAIQKYGDPCSCSIQCSVHSSYNELMILADTDTDACMSVNSVWHILDDLEVKSPVCRKKAQQHLQDNFRHDKSSQCMCTASQPLRNENIQRISNGSITYCEQSNAYRGIENQFFSNIRHYGCQDHRHLWSLLENVSPQHGVDCQKDLIIRTAVRYPSATQDSCSCSPANKQCSVHSSYNELMSLANTDACMSVNSVWHILDDLEVKSPVCRKNAQQHLQDKFRHDQSSQCMCTARRQLHNRHIQYINNGSLTTCERSTAFRGIEHQFFSNIRQYGCQDHRHLWSLLENVSPQQGVDCQKDLIIRTAVEYPSATQDPCMCSSANNISNSTPQTIHSNGTVSPTNSTAIVSPTVSTTIVSPTNSAASVSQTISTTIVSPTDTTVSVTPAISTTPAFPTDTTVSVSPAISTTLVSPTDTTVSVSPAISTTLVSPTNSAQPTTDATLTNGAFTATTTIPFLACNKLTTIETIAKAIHVTYPNSSFCDPDAGGSDDDFTRTVCHLTSPTTWKKGMSVMDACKTPQVIPQYTSIATFTRDTHSSNGGQSGVFVKCEENGFSMAIQKCNGVPTIVRIDTNGVLTRNPYNYYTIS